MKSRILYVDDEVDLLELAASFFQDEDLVLETCADFNQAVELIQKQKYDLIISDAKMPHGSGYQLFQIIKKQGHFQGKLILVTGNLDRSPEEADYDLVIYKPLNFQELISTVKNLLKV